MQTEANIVIVGGGVLGTSIAYHLARNGAKGVLLLRLMGSADFGDHLKREI